MYKKIKYLFIFSLIFVSILSLNVNATATMHENKQVPFSSSYSGIYSACGDSVNRVTGWLSYTNRAKTTFSSITRTEIVSYVFEKDSSGQMRSNTNTTITGTCSCIIDPVSFVPVEVIHRGVKEIPGACVGIHQVRAS